MVTFNQAEGAVCVDTEPMDICRHRDRKLLGSVLSTLIVSRYLFGIYFIFIYRTVVTPAEQLPATDLGSHHVCLPISHGMGEYVSTSIAVTFDVLAFSILVATTYRRS